MGSWSVPGVNDAANVRHVVRMPELLAVDPLPSNEVGEGSLRRCTAASSDATDFPNEGRTSQEDLRYQLKKTKQAAKYEKPPVPAEKPPVPGDAFLFADQEQMKAKVREALIKPVYDVRDFYHETGLWQQIARSVRFENLTLFVISVNAVWLSIDTEFNNAAFLLDADIIFQIAEQFFCLYFSFEWTVRFMAFKRKRDGLKDKWFVFDSCLVISMVGETWVMSSILTFIVEGKSSSPLGNVTVLRLFRLLRLSRLARMLRSMPELMILIKGMVAAMRSVFFVLVLLLILMYIFAITFTQLTAGTQAGNDLFNGMFASMITLTCTGMFLDNLTDVLTALSADSVVYSIVFLLFILLAALTVLNMLIGVLCEVVSAVAATEKEEMLVSFVKGRMRDVLCRIDKDGDGNISRREFERILGDAEAVSALVEVGVDPEVLVDNVDFLFEQIKEDVEDKDDGVLEVEEVVMDFPRFMEVIMQFRGSNTATLKDVVDLRKHLNNEVRNLTKKIRRMTSNRCGTPNTFTSSTNGREPTPKGIPVLPSQQVPGGPVDCYGFVDGQALFEALHNHTSRVESLYAMGQVELFRIQKVLPVSCLAGEEKLGLTDCRSLRSLPWVSTGERLEQFFTSAQEESDALRALFMHMKGHEQLRDDIRTWLSKVELAVIQLRHFVQALKKGSANELALFWQESVALNELLGVELTKLKDLREVIRETDFDLWPSEIQSLSCRSDAIDEII